MNNSVSTTDLVNYLEGKVVIANLRQLLERMADGVVAIDKDATIFYTNPAYSRIIGVSAESVLGCNMRVIEPEAAILQVLDTGKPLATTVQVKSVNVYVQVSIWPLYEQGRLSGAFSFFRDVSQEVHMQRELHVAQNLAEHFRQQLEGDQLAGGHGMVGAAPAFMEAQKKAYLVAPTNAAVLILGEHGVGKEVMARAIHQASARREKPFIAINCAALPESLLESELFGYEEGAFTDAKKGGRLGKFELAQGGTLFLDEIGDMPLAMQAKLLRALQEKEIEKIGRDKAIIIDVRVIAASNRDMQAMISEGGFRADLFYRLNVVNITLPPLRERPSDIVPLCQYFLRKCREKYNKQLTLAKQSLAIIRRHNWPGNVRELQNCIEYAAIMCPGGDILPEHLPNHLMENTVPSAALVQEELNWRQAIENLEIRLLSQALASSQDNRSQAIRSLGLSRRAFYRKLKQYGLC